MTTTIATCAFPATDDVAKSLALHLDYIDEAARRGAALVVFPELSLHSYPPDVRSLELQPVLERVYSLVESVPDGDSVRAIADRAVERGIHVIYGLHEAGERRGVVYNTAVLTGPTGHIGGYRKVHVGVGERLIWRVGHDWPVFDSGLGRIGMLICWDKDFPESTRELTMRGAELLVAPTAWGQLPGTGIDADSLSVRMYDLFDRARAAENGRWYVSSNFVGELGGREYIGHSQIVNPLGDVVATSGDSGVGLTLATIDIEAGIADAYAAWEGPYVVRDGRPETYLALRGELPTVIDG
ncbi:MAG: carbon-nitrogen hydrolase family protein [Solirubrobacteraceae bacterium]